MATTSAMFRQSSAHGKGDGKNDRKERFHGTTVFVVDRSRALIRWSSRYGADRRFKLNKRSGLRASGMIAGPDKKTIIKSDDALEQRDYSLLALLQFPFDPRIGNQPKKCAEHVESAGDP